MASFDVWLEILSWTKALFEATTAGEKLYEAHEKHRQERDTISEARRVSVVFASTYSHEEEEALLRRVEACRDRFVAEGSGASRRACLCSIFKDAIDGNGGTLPQIDNFDFMFRQLNCPKQRSVKPEAP